ncbi:hypothetical protein VNO77_01788 [Canavalia gladiata]|uniref:Uncharacterized protein n=1 Tax=Canavalia gladiata TaxID=3824 RepID=A0AAN9RAM1_CANGL
MSLSPSCPFLYVEKRTACLVPHGTSQQAEVTRKDATNPDNGIQPSRAYEMRDVGAVLHSHGIESCLVTMLNPLSKEFRLIKKKRWFMFIGSCSCGGIAVAMASGLKVSPKTRKHYYLRCFGDQVWLLRMGF